MNAHSLTLDPVASGDLAIHRIVLRPTHAHVQLALEAEAKDCLFGSPTKFMAGDQEIEENEKSFYAN